MIWRRVLIVAAAVAVLAVIFPTYQQVGYFSQYMCYPSDSDFIQSVDLPFRPADIADGSYPYRWQTAQRERFRALMERPEHPPTGKDALSQARFAQYAMRHDDEAAFREGIRREPGNALYHYLLADLLIHQSLTGYGLKTDKATVRLYYDYQITDRRKLDQGMHELAIGLRLPYQSHRATLLRARIAAMPPVRSFQDKIQMTLMMSGEMFPIYAKMRNFARVNGFYLNVLLAEGKRAEAEPFLHTGERLPVQLSNDSPPTLIGQVAASAISALCGKRDAYVCREHGLTREAATIEASHQALMSKVDAWRMSARKEHFSESPVVIEHTSGFASFMLPVMSTGQQGLVTADTLAPSRRVEYSLVEQIGIAGLAMLFFLLMLYAGLKVWRGALLLRGKAQQAPLSLTRADWRQIIGVGFLLPLALYLVYINIPALSGRDHGIGRVKVQFFSGLSVAALWMLIVPTTLAAGKLWRYGIAAGMITVEKPWKTRVTRLNSALGALVWVGLAFFTVFAPVSLLLFSTINVWVRVSPLLVPLAIGIAVLAVPLVPLVWLHSRRATAAHHLALARAMVPLYAVFTLLLGALLPVAMACERYYVQHDKVLGIMVTKETINVTQVEGAITLMLRGYINDGARQLQINWEKPSNK